MAEMNTLLLLLLTSKLASAEWYPAICDCNELNSQNDFTCVCTDFALNKSYVYPLSELPSNNFTNPVRLFLGDVDTQRGQGEMVECGTSTAFELATILKPSKVLQPEFVVFNNFDFDNSRTYQIDPWLVNVRSSLKQMQIMCGTMKTLHAGIFRGFPSLYHLGILQTGLHDIDPRAFAELTGGTISTLKEFYVIGNPLQSFDWSVLEPVAQSLESITLRFNNVSEMHVTSSVSFPALQEVNFQYNKLERVSANVVALFPERLILIILNGNRLCPMDSLCRCCSTLPLFQYAKRTGSLVEVECGPTKTRLYCEDTPIRRSPQCTSQCIKFGNLTDIVQLSDYDYCPDSDVGTMSCEV